MEKWVVGLLALAAAGLFGWSCSGTEGRKNADDDSQGTDTGTGTDSDSDSDSDSDGDAGGDSDADTDITTDNGCPGEVQSFIWISNTAEGTLSKVCTTNGVEVARYSTSEQGAIGDPSRTSVNRHGDMVVTNRDPTSGPSSVTKFAGDVKDCIDRNSDGHIDTSSGPTDVLPFGDDECMLWNTKFPGAASIGARATAWDGEEDEKTGKGGHVWIGALLTSRVFQIDGDTGKILKTGKAPLQPYGGAVDGKGAFWMVGAWCTVGLCQIARMDMATMQAKAYQVTCGYGISVDAKGRVWTSGVGCVNRFDPATETNKFLKVGGAMRGLAVDGKGSVWSANTNGQLYQVDEADVTLVKKWQVGVAEMIGVAVDYDHYIWAVSQGGNETYKIDPVTYDTIYTVKIGSGPYTYSDMTGMQLRNVVPVE
jgi:hypothetical protein